MFAKVALLSLNEKVWIGRKVSLRESARLASSASKVVRTFLGQLVNMPAEHTPRVRRFTRVLPEHLLRYILEDAMRLR